MKKNFSFLKSTLVLGLLSLFGVDATAQTPSYETIWGTTETVAVGDVVTFVDKTNKKVYNGYKQAASYDNNPLVGVGLKVAAGSDSGTYSFKAIENGAVTEKYFIETGEIDVNELTKEVSWTVANSQIKSASTAAKYVYYDTAKKYFWTTANARTCDIFKQYAVPTPVFNTAAGTYAVMTDNATFPVKITAASAAAAGTTPKLYGTADGAVIKYQISEDGVVKKAWADYTGAVDLKDYVTTMNLTAAKTVKLEAKTVYESGETSVKSVEYKLILMQPITFSTTINNQRVADDGTYPVKVASNGNGTEVKAGFAANALGNAAQKETTLDIAAKAKFQETAETVKVYASATRLGCTITANYDFFVNTNVLPSEVFGNIVTDPVADASPLNVVCANESFKSKYSTTKNYAYTINTPAATEVKIKVGTTEYNAKKVEKDGDNLVITIPYEVKNVDYNVVLPANTFVATIRSGNKTVNTFGNPVKELGYHAGNAKVTYNITPDQIEVAVNADNEALAVPFNLWPVNTVTTTYVASKSGSAIDVKITKIDNTLICNATAEKKAGTNNEFEVKFNASQIADYIRASETVETGVLVVFPKNSLVSAAGDENNEEITSRIKFIEAVNFAISLNSTKACEHDGYFDITVAATGKVNTARSYATALSTTVANKVKVNNKDCVIAPAKDASGNVIANQYRVTFKDVIKKNKNGYAINIPAGLFIASKSVSLAKTDATIDIYAHPAYTYLPVMGKENKSMTLKVTATLDQDFTYEENAGDLTNIEARPIKIDGNNFTYTLGSLVKDTNKKVQTLTLNINNNYDTDILSDVVNGGVHTFNILPNTFQAASSCKNAAFTGTYTVKPWVVFATDPFKLDSLNTSETEVKFNVYLKAGTNKVPFTGDLKAGTEKDANAPKLTYNDGQVDKQATITKIEKTATAGTYVVTAKLQEALKARANNYELYVPENALWADNFNVETFSVAFKVFNHIQIAAGDDAYAKTADKNIKVQLRGYDVVDATEDAKVNLKIAANAKGIEFRKDGAKLYDVTIENTNGLFTVKLPANAAALAIGGNYSVVFPAGTVVANASKNPADITVKVNVIDYIYAIADKTVNTLEDAGWNLTNVPVEVYEMKADGSRGAKVSTMSIQCSNLSKIKVADKSNTNVALSDVTFNQNKIGTTTYLKADKSQYTLTVDKDVLSFEYKGLEFKNAVLSAKITIKREFDFSNNVNGTTSTLNTAIPVKTGVVVNYAQDFSAKQKESICLPFNVKYDQISAQANVWKIITVFTGEDGVTYFVRKALKAGETMYANRPYVIEPKTDDNKIRVALTDVNLAQAVSTATSCASITDAVVFKGTSVNETGKITEKVTVAKNSHKAIYYYSGNEMKYQNTDEAVYTGSINFKIWKWYGIGESKGIKYVKAIDFEDIDDATLINAINANENQTIFNVNGMKLNKAQKGINIINGKKVMVK